MQATLRDVSPQELFVDQKVLPKTKFSVIMPIYNGGLAAGEKVLAAVKKWESLTDDFEIIVVDDGSTDSTHKALSAIRDERVNFVSYAPNKGKGAAILHGFKYVRGNIVIFADGDLEALPIYFKDYIQTLDEADIVVASKRARGAQVYAGSKRKFLSAVFNTFVKILLPISVSDTQAGFKVFRRSALDRILPLISVKRYAFDVELLAMAKLLNLKVAELPAKVSLGSDFDAQEILRMLLDLLGIAYRYRIRCWYQKSIVASNEEAYAPLLR